MPCGFVSGFVKPIVEVAPIFRLSFDGELFSVYVGVISGWRDGAESVICAVGVQRILLCCGLDGCYCDETVSFDCFSCACVSCCGRSKRAKLSV